ncbi:MAG: thiolase [Solirubrobacterales bacterium]|nr:thiolase [Solirubrobacterales bacterium]
MREVFLVGVGATGFGAPSHARGMLAAEAAGAALDDAGVSAHDLTAATVGGRQASDRGLKLTLDGTPCLGRPSTWAGRALQRAWQAVAAGDDDLVLCVGSSGAPADCHPLPSQAEAARRYMARTGATAEHLARITVKNRRLGADNPRVLAGGRVDVAAVLASEVVAWPLRRLMVAPAATGAAAVVLASREGLRRTASREVRVRASVLVTAADGEAAATRAARLAYQNAGLGPEDLDCAELDDRTAAGELAAYEALQFVPDGQGPELVESGFTALGGVLPVNTSGGLLSQGDATGASGLAQVCELSWQLRGKAGLRQVAGASAGLALSGYEKRDDGPAFVSLLIFST